MTSAEVVAVALFAGVTLYAVFAGADFGGGFWDLVAGGAERGAAPRALIDDAIGPVWEANHVWLIFCLVVLWTAFPTAFASITLTLFIPLLLAAVGIVLRGSGFAFRRVVRRLTDQRRLGAAFAISSVVVPFCMGAIAGGIASGRVPSGGASGDLVDSWVNPTSILGGVLAVTTCAYLAAVFLVNDARRRRDADLEVYFRRRAIGAAVVAGLVAVAGVFILRDDARRLYDGLLDRGWPLIVLSALSGGGALFALVRGAPRPARALAVLAVASVVWGWGVAQWPYLLPNTLKINAAAAPSATLTAVIVVTVVAVLVVVPSLALLYVLTQRSLLEPEPPPRNE